MNIQANWKLDPDISIAGAELSAIYKASEWLFNVDNLPGTVVILTDSKVSLQLLLHRNPKSYALGVKEIHNNLRLLRYARWKIYLQWVPSHCGIQGNHTADLLAGQAHEIATIDEYPLEFEERLTRLHLAFTKKWQEKWTSVQETNPRNFLRKLKDTIGPWPHTHVKNRAIDVILTRFRLGHSRLNEHMHKMNLLQSPACTKCDLQCPETILHFIKECAFYALQREVMLNNLQSIGIRNPSLDLLLGKSNLEEGSKKFVTHEMARYIHTSQRISEL